MSGVGATVRAVVILAALVAASWWSWETFRPKRVVHRVELPAVSLPDRVRLLANGTEVAPDAGALRSLLVAGLPSSRLLFERTLPRLRVEGLLPCGWRALPHEAQRSPDPRELAAGRSGDPVPLQLRVSGVRDNDAEVWVDNRGGAGVELRVGELPVPIKADFTGRIDVTIADCEAGTVAISRAPSRVTTWTQRLDSSAGRIQETLEKQEVSRCHHGHRSAYG